MLIPVRDRWNEVVNIVAFIQDEHERGRPYAYDVGDVRFIVTTDEEAWATEAIARLCPEPEPEAGG